jgi:hypothetical protein
MYVERLLSVVSHFDVGHHFLKILFPGFDNVPPAFAVSFFVRVLFCRLN